MLEHKGVGRIRMKHRVLLGQRVLGTPHICPHRRKRLRLAVVAALRIQYRTRVDTPALGVDVVEHPEHHTVRKLLDNEPVLVFTRRQRLAVVALGRRNTHRTILGRIPYDRAECTDVRHRQIALSLDVVNHCKGALRRRVIYDTQVTTFLRLEESTQVAPRRILLEQRCERSKRGRNECHLEERKEKGERKCKKRRN